ncbi:MAG: phage baseplate protein, partial [Cetobacterium sp.]
MATTFTRFLKLFIDDRSNFAMLIRDFLENYKKLDEFAEKTDLRIFDLENNKCPYNIGDVYLTTNNTDPSIIWRATQWEKVTNRETFLMINSDLTDAGLVGGRNTITLVNNNIPIHTHGVTVKDGGSHNHVINIDYAGLHGHGANITAGGNHSHDSSDHSHSI